MFLLRVVFFEIKFVQAFAFSYSSSQRDVHKIWRLYSGDERFVHADTDSFLDADIRTLNVKT